MTLESAAAAKLVLMVWCSGHRSEPDPALIALLKHPIADGRIIDE